MKMDQVVEDPPFARMLFNDVRLSWIWLILRIYIGWQWLEAGWTKLFSSAWFGGQAGGAITGFVNGALSKTTGDHPDVQGWYAWFLQNLVLPYAKFWSNLVAIGETLVGIALILGIFTGIAAIFGSFMNANYLLAGTVSLNPGMLIITVLLILAWKTAGWLGLDHWVLPALGAPWQPGHLFKIKPKEMGESKT